MKVSCQPPLPSALRFQSIYGFSVARVFLFYFPSVCLFSMKTRPDLCSVIEKDLVWVSCGIHLGISVDVLSGGLDCFSFQPGFSSASPHFLLLCVTVITFIFEYELKIPLFQFSLFFSELIPSLALPLSCHCQCLLSCRVWFQLQSQLRNEFALLPPFLSTQCSTSPVLPHLNSCSLLHLMVALCVSCCLHVCRLQKRKSKRGRRQERKEGACLDHFCCTSSAINYKNRLLLPLLWSLSV